MLIGITTANIPFCVVTHFHGVNERSVTLHQAAKHKIITHTKYIHLFVKICSALEHCIWKDFCTKTLKEIMWCLIKLVPSSTPCTYWFWQKYKNTFCCHDHCEQEEDTWEEGPREKLPCSRSRKVQAVQSSQWHSFYGTNAESTCNNQTIMRRFALVLRLQATMNLLIEQTSNSSPRKSLHFKLNFCFCSPNTRGVNPYDDLYGEASRERGTFFRLQVYKRAGTSLIEVYKRVFIGI